MQAWPDLSGGERHALRRDDECPSFASCAIGGRKGSPPIPRTPPFHIGRKGFPSQCNAPHLPLCPGLPAVSFAKGETLIAAAGCCVRTVALVAQFRSTCDCMMLFSQVDYYMITI